MPMYGGYGGGQQQSLQGRDGIAQALMQVRNPPPGGVIPPDQMVSPPMGMPQQQPAALAPAAPAAGPTGPIGTGSPMGAMGPVGGAFQPGLNLPGIQQPGQLPQGMQPGGMQMPGQMGRGY
jgi:hypothetical protein